MMKAHILVALSLGWASLSYGSSISWRGFDSPPFAPSGFSALPDPISLDPFAVHETEVYFLAWRDGEREALAAAQRLSRCPNDFPSFLGPFDPTTEADILEDIQVSQVIARELYDSAPMVRCELKDIWKKAHNGDANSQFQLGEVYFKGGYNVRQNYLKAQKWYLSAEKQGNREAKFVLASIYAKGCLGQHGVCVPQDSEKAESLCRQAAQMGHLKAIEAVKILDEEDGSIIDTRSMQRAKRAFERLENDEAISRIVVMPDAKAESEAHLHEMLAAAAKSIWDDVD